MRSARVNSQAAHQLLVMKVVEPTDRAEEKGPARLTVKDKVLLQMGEFPCEFDLGEFPFELTQKGCPNALARGEAT